MNGTVPVLSMIFMAVSCVIGFCIPVALLLCFRIKKRADFLPFFIGCAVFILFALVLEALVHQVVLGSETGARIQENVWLFALYGGLMAGLFEETGRFLAFKFMPKKYRVTDANALMYGAGHGGCESAIVLGMTMINNLTYSVMINSGKIAAVLEPLPGELKAQMETAVRGLITTKPHEFLLGGVERIFAVTLHISLSVLVWFAAKKRGRFWLFPAAIGLHAFMDAAAVVLSGYGVNVLLIEAVVAVIAVISALIARLVWRANAQTADAAEGSPPEQAPQEESGHED